MMKYIPAELLSTFPSHVAALLSLGCTEDRANELMEEASMGSNGREILIDVGEDRKVAITTGEDGQSMLWEAYYPLACETQKLAIDFIEHVEERRKEPSTWMVLEWTEAKTH